MGFFKNLLKKVQKSRYVKISNVDIICNLNEEDMCYLEKNAPHKDIVVNKETSN